MFGTVSLRLRDTEIDELRTQLCRMQDDWVEEECHRVEAQLALKEARREIQQLKQAVDTVRTRLSDAGGMSGDVGVQKYFQDINAQNHKLENLLLNMELAQAGLTKEGEGIAGGRTRVGRSAPASVSGESPGGVPRLTVGGRGSCSCDGSPARSLTRSSTYTKLSDQALADRHNGMDFPCLSGDGTQDSGFVCCGDTSLPSRADLLLEAAYLSEETASLLSSYTQTFSHSLPHSAPHSFPHMSHPLPHSSTCDKLCAADRLAPYHCGLGGVSCVSHPCLSHHHLYLHPLREAGIQTESCPVPATSGCPSDLDTIAEQRTFRSQACSPTSTWMSDDVEEDLDSLTTTTSATTATVMSTATEPLPVSKTPPLPPLPRSATVACSMESPGRGGRGQPEEERREEDDSVAEDQVEAAEVSQTGKDRLTEREPDGTGKGPDGTGEASQAELAFVGCCGDQTEKTVRNRSDEDGQPEVGSSSDLRPSPGERQPRTSQPRRSTAGEEAAGVTVVEVDDDEEKTNEPEDGDPSGSGNVQKSYWSRHFLVDLLAVAIPVVPTVAWLCRGPVRGGQPVYHIGSLLRGCCTVALHSLRRGGGLRHYPAGGGDLGGSQI